MNTKDVYENVKCIIDELDVNKKEYVKDPLKHHTRKRKVTFSDCILSCLCMSGGTLFSEMLEFFEGKDSLPSRSALIQQRLKIKPEAFAQLFKLTCNIGKRNNLYKGYRLFAVDGSDLQIPLNRNDSSTYFSGTNGQKPYNLMHLNAMYDLVSCTYEDVRLQGRWDWNEADAAISMLNASSVFNAILIADRGYESYNLMAHAKEKGWKFLIRIKDASKNGIASRLTLPNTPEFDEYIELNITRKNSKRIKELAKQYPNRYKYTPPNSRLDFLPEHSKYKDEAVFYHLPFRILRISIGEDKFETIATNLDAEEFPLSEIKKLYEMRWGIETSFRTLKYNVGLIYFHSKKKELILQEIYARLAMFNIVSAISSIVPVKCIGCKHEYAVNLAQATHICRKLFLARISPHTAEQLISKSVVPIRKGRKFKRRATARIAINLIYRVS